MGRLIDAEKLKVHYCWWAGGGREMTLDEAKKTFDTIIDLQQTVDAVEVVRCKDCRWWYTEDEFCYYMGMGDPRGYCSLGERGEDGLGVTNQD